MSAMMYVHGVCAVVQEWLKAACGEGVCGDDFPSSGCAGEQGSLSSSSSHLNVQLADLKAQLRRLRQEQ